MRTIKLLPIPLFVNLFPSQNMGMSVMDNIPSMQSSAAASVRSDVKLWNNKYLEFSAADNHEDYDRPLTPQEKTDYEKNGFTEIEKIIYAEAANQPEINRRLVARTILNRVSDRDNYSHPSKVIYGKNAFTCTFDGSRLWRQAKGRLRMNKIEKEAFMTCKKNALEVYLGKRENIPREDEIIAYHDISISKPNDTYWNSLEEVYKNDRLIFYAPKQNLASNSNNLEKRADNYQ
ncbi:MAG: cell wall hydrolase [archaeon]|nr:cell wall hydrolase [archaeon]